MFTRALTFGTTRVNGLGVKNREKSITDLIIESSVEFFGCAPDESPNENREWMRKNGYRIKKVYKRGCRR